MSERLIKYGRTPHLPSSQGATRDDRIITDLSPLLAAPDIVVTEKMDGENTTMHAQGCHPRSPEARDHPSRDWMKAFAAGISPMLASDERVVGEYLYARHAIAYGRLPSFFLGFAWIVGGTIQGWDDTLARFTELGITPVPQLYRGSPGEAVIAQLETAIDTTAQEGFVIRNTAPFAEDAMQLNLAKWVRAGHVQTETHWMNAPIIPNKLAK